MVDELYRPQSSLILNRWCCAYDDLEVCEELIGLYTLESTSADMVGTAIKDILLHMNLTINNCRGQCYDGGSNMPGAQSGVATRLTDLKSRVLYTHYYEHALNLAIQDVVKSVKVMEDTLDTVYETTKLIKKPPKLQHCQYMRVNNLLKQHL